MKVRAVLARLDKVPYLGDLGTGHYEVTLSFLVDPGDGGSHASWSVKDRWEDSDEPPTTKQVAASLRVMADRLEELEPPARKREDS